MVLVTGVVMVGCTMRPVGLPAGGTRKSSWRVCNCGGRCRWRKRKRWLRITISREQLTLDGWGWGRDIKLAQLFSCGVQNYIQFRFHDTQAGRASRRRRAPVKLRRRPEAPL
jgi:hypothetical protein